MRLLVVNPNTTASMTATIASAARLVAAPATVIDALMRVQLDHGVPVLSVVLTPKDFHEHETHRAFFSQHFVAKGAEAARACAQTLAAHAALATRTAFCVQVAICGNRGLVVI